MAGWTYNNDGQAVEIDDNIGGGIVPYIPPSIEFPGQCVQRYNVNIQIIGKLNSQGHLCGYKWTARVTEIAACDGSGWTKPSSVTSEKTIIDQPWDDMCLLSYRMRIEVRGGACDCSGAVVGSWSQSEDVSFRPCHPAGCDNPVLGLLLQHLINNCQLVGRLPRCCEDDDPFYIGQGEQGVTERNVIDPRDEWNNEWDPWRKEKYIALYGPPPGVVKTIDGEIIRPIGRIRPKNARNRDRGLNRDEAVWFGIPRHLIVESLLKAERGENSHIPLNKQRSVPPADRIRNQDVESGFWAGIPTNIRSEVETHLNSGREGQYRRWRL